MADLRENAVTKLATITGINAKTVAVTTLFTVPPGKTLVVVEIVTRITAWVAGAGGAVTCSFGGNPANYNDYLVGAAQPVGAAAIAWSNWAAAKTALPMPYAAAINFSMNITTGSTATTETWAVDLFGYLI